MLSEDFFEKIGDLKKKFFGLFQQEKKVKALENYSEGEGKFPHRNYLTLVKRCISDGFLGEHEAGFLDYMLAKYEVNYLDWHHKTKWVKKMISEKKSTRSHSMQPMFNFAQGSPVHIPTHLLAQSKTGTSARI